MFLTEEEIRELTNRKQRSAQVMVLNALGITHKVRPDGSLVVLRAHVEHELGYRTPPPAKKEKEFEPNSAFLRLEPRTLREGWRMSTLRAAGINLVM